MRMAVSFSLFRRTQQVRLSEYPLLISLFRAAFSEGHAP